VYTGVIEDDVPHEPKKLDPPNGPFRSARSLLPCHDSGLRKVQERSTEHAMSSIFGVQLSISYTFANFRGRVYNTTGPQRALLKRDSTGIPYFVVT
jgi:hypothetical protein